MSATPSRTGHSDDARGGGGNGDGQTPVPFKTPRQGDGFGLSMDDLRGNSPSTSEIDTHSAAQLGLAWQFYGDGSPMTVSPKRRATAQKATHTPTLGSDNNHFASPRRLVDRIRAINPNFQYANNNNTPRSAFDTPGGGGGGGGGGGDSATVRGAGEAGRRKQRAKRGNRPRRQKKDKQQ